MKIVAAVAAAASVLLAGAADPPWDWGDANDEWNSSPGFESSKALCRQLRGRDPPPADRPDAATAAALRGCDSEALYYGIGVPADPVRARQCAFLEAGREDGEGPFSGRAMLMTIYANGLGATRDLDVAIRLACGIEGAPMESHGRVMHLAGLKAEGGTGSDFHYCDDITSGLAGGYCAHHGARIAGADRAAALAALTAGWTDTEKRALGRLQRAHAAYAGAHSGGEIDLAGTLRAAFQVEAEEALNDELLDMLKRLAAGDAPRFTAAQLRAADAELNAEYRELMRGPFDDYPGAVTREGIRSAQRAWLRYRDSFLAFAAIAYPRVAPDALAAWLTRRRTELLRGDKEEAP
jgi:uncharacterized protein YecT (DUF1311 family)